MQSQPSCQFSLPMGCTMPDESDEAEKPPPTEANGFELTEKRKRQAQGRAAAEQLWNEIKQRLSEGQ